MILTTLLVKKGSYNRLFFSGTLARDKFIPKVKSQCELSAQGGPPQKREDVMKRKNTKRDEMCDEYMFDYSKAVRGKHFQRLIKEGANVVVLEPDVAKVFRGSAAVNDALRSLLQVSKSTLRLTSRSTIAGRKRAVG